MADVAESVQSGVKRLCKSLLDQAFRSAYEGDFLLTSLQPPSKNTPWDEWKRENILRILSQVTYDLLLLRKWAWFGSWSHTPLSPLCWCRAYSYGYHTRGKEREGERLSCALDTFISNSESVFFPSPTSLIPPFSWRRLQSPSGERCNSHIPGSAGWRHKPTASPGLVHGSFESSILIGREKKRKRSSTPLGKAFREHIFSIDIVGNNLVPLSLYEPCSPLQMDSSVDSGILCPDLCSRSASVCSFSSSPPPCALSSMFEDAPGSSSQLSSISNAIDHSSTVG